MEEVISRRMLNGATTEAKCADLQHPFPDSLELGCNSLDKLSRQFKEI